MFWRRIFQTTTQHCFTQLRNHKAYTQHFFNAWLFSGVALCGVMVPSLTYNEEKIYTAGEAIGVGLRGEIWKKKHDNVTILDLDDEPAQFLLTCLRNKGTKGIQLKVCIDRIIRHIIGFCNLKLPTNEIVIETPDNYKFQGIQPESEVAVNGLILDNGSIQFVLPFAQAVHEVFPDSRHTIIEIPNSNETKVLENMIPIDLEIPTYFLIFEVEISSVTDTKNLINFLKTKGVQEKNIILVSLLSNIHLVEDISSEFGDIQFIVGAADPEMSNGKIVPGFGNVNLRYAEAVESTSNCTDTHTSHQQHSKHKFKLW